GNIEISACEFAKSEVSKLPLYRHAVAQKCKTIASFPNTELSQVSNHENLIVIGDYLLLIVGTGVGYGGIPKEIRPVLAFLKKEHLVKDFLILLKNKISKIGVGKNFSLINLIQELRLTKTVLKNLAPLIASNGTYYASLIRFVNDEWKNRVERAENISGSSLLIRKSLNKQSLIPFSGCFNVDLSPSEIEININSIADLIEINRSSSNAGSNSKSIFESKKIEPSEISAETSQTALPLLD
ncbi:MAG: hypothetical protein AABZ55_07270, partial [Bdellovibrionota bacterium]